MKLNHKILVKKTKRLFMDKYQYKTVLVCPVANWFRGGDLDHVREKLQLIDSKKLPLDTPLWNKLKTPDDLEYCIKLESLMSKMTNYEIRIEHPLLSFYSNNFNNCVELANLEISRTKYVSVSNNLKPNTVYLPKIKYGFRVTMGRTRSNHLSFLNWSKNNDKIKITKNCYNDLARDKSWGGNYFYVKDEKSLTLVKMFLGSEISRIDVVINENPTK